MFTRSNSHTQNSSAPGRSSSEYYFPGSIPNQEHASTRPFVVDQAKNNFYHEESSPGTYDIGHHDGFGHTGSVAFAQSYDRRNITATASHIRQDQYHNSEDESGQDRKGELPSLLTAYHPPSSQSDYQQTSPILAPHSEHSGDSEFWSPTGQGASPEPQRPRKSRREKPRIELAPDQPPTTQGKPRARVYVACLQCRTRKIRCDGAKPICHNCGRRGSAGSECNYDAVPKRRGPDKTPGARQRMARDARNAIEGPIIPTRRRRRRESQSVTQVDNQAAQQVMKDVHNTNASLSPSISLPSLVPVEVVSSPSQFNDIPVDLRSPYSLQCSCHGVHHCPNLLDVAVFSQSRKGLSPHNNAMSCSYVGPQITQRMNSYSHESQFGYITELDENDNEPENNSKSPDITSQPSLTFSKKIWWDSLLSLYLSPSSTRLHRLSSSQRESASQGIASDLRFLFKASNYWFSFFHIPSFFGNFFDPTKRERIQPCLILAMLAMSTFWQSSEVGLGNTGRERALRFRDEAQSALEASFNAGWIDETLAQAAWLLSLFEVCAHPLHSSERATSALVMLDSIIRSLSLTSMDVDNPDATMFTPGSVPAVDSTKPRERNYWFPNTTSSPDRHSIAEGLHPRSQSPGHMDNEAGCSCSSMTLVEYWPSATEHAPMWAPTPAWNEAWSEGEIRRESCRRLCWSSMILAAGHISYTTAHRSEALDLFIANPANYALLFSGESIARSPSYSSKDTIWALHDRSFLLWHGCVRMRHDSHASETDKAHFAVKAWIEADALETALNKHTCAIERAFIFQAREYIFNTRMCISYEFQRFIPLVTANVSGLFHRSKAEEWLSHQASVAERFMYGLHAVTGNANNLLARRPFFVFWFMGQISRALSLFRCDSTLTVALDVCKALLPAIDYLTALWPCAEQRIRYETLRASLNNACYSARVSPPPPQNIRLPPPSPEALI